MQADELDYDLPEALIAQAPLPRRDGARLLCVDGAALSHRAIVDLPHVVPEALWVVNDTRVIPARLFGEKPSGGKVELLLVERDAGDDRCDTWWCMGRTSKGLKVGMEFALGPDFQARVIDVRAEDGLRKVELRAASVSEAIEHHGRMPLPPYIERDASELDLERYQTVYAREAGAVAAPTAGLHLSTELMDRLRACGHRFAQVTLHVGPGTFAPLRSESLAEHPMHAERYVVPQETADAIAEARSEGRPVMAVGTTVVRTLEASALEGGLVHPGPGQTDIFIYPPYRFQVVDLLLTNFHLPRSTLLALVMAFAGEDAIRHAYATAVQERYRFFSYGDAMFLRRQP